MLIKMCVTVFMQSPVLQHVQEQTVEFMSCSKYTLPQQKHSSSKHKHVISTAAKDALVVSSIFREQEAFLSFLFSIEMWISQDQALDFYAQLLIISGLHSFNITASYCEI